MSIFFLLFCAHNKNNNLFRKKIVNNIDEIKPINLTNEITTNFIPSMIQHNQKKNNYILWDELELQYIILDGTYFHTIYKGKFNLNISNIESIPNVGFILYNNSQKKIKIIQINNDSIADTTLTLSSFPTNIISKGDTGFLIDKKRKLYRLKSSPPTIQFVEKISKQKKTNLIKKYVKKKTLRVQFSKNVASLITSKNNRYGKFNNKFSNLLINKNKSNIYSKNLKHNITNLEHFVNPSKTGIQNLQQKKLLNKIISLNNKYSTYSEQANCNNLKITALPAFNEETKTHVALLIDHHYNKIIEVGPFPNLANNITFEYFNSRMTFWIYGQNAVHILDINKLHKKLHNDKSGLIKVPITDLKQITISNIFSNFIIDSQNNYLYCYDQSLGKLVKFRKTDFHREGQYDLDFHLDSLLFNSKNHKIIGLGRQFDGDKNSQIIIFDSNKNKQEKRISLNSLEIIRNASIDPINNILFYTLNHEQGIGYCNLKTEKISKIGENKGFYSHIVPNSYLKQIHLVRYDKKRFYIDQFLSDENNIKTIEKKKGRIVNIAFDNSDHKFYYAFNKSKNSYIYYLDTKNTPHKIFSKNKFHISNIHFDLKNRIILALFSNYDKSKTKDNIIIVLSLDNPNYQKEIQVNNQYNNFVIDQSRNEILLTNKSGTKVIQFYYNPLLQNCFYYIDKQPPVNARILNRNLIATPYPGRVNLKWDNHSQDSKYYIHRSIKQDCGFSPINKSPIDSTSFVDFLAKINRTYYYLVSDTSVIEGNINTQYVKQVKTPQPNHIILNLAKEVIFFREDKSVTQPLTIDLIIPSYQKSNVKLTYAIFEDIDLANPSKNSGIKIPAISKYGKLFNSSTKTNVNIKYNKRKHDSPVEEYFIAFYATSENQNYQVALDVLKVIIVKENHFKAAKKKGMDMVIFITDGTKYQRLGYPTKLFGKLFVINSANNQSLPGSMLPITLISENEEILKKNTYINSDNEFSTSICLSSTSNWYVSIDKSIFKLPYYAPFEGKPFITPLPLPSNLFNIGYVINTPQYDFFNIGGIVTLNSNELVTVEMNFQRQDGSTEKELVTTNELGRYNILLPSLGKNQINYSCQIRCPENTDNADIDGQVCTGNPKAYIFLFTPHFRPYRDIWGSPRRYNSVNYNMRKLYFQFYNCNVSPAGIHFYNIDQTQDPLYENIPKVTEYSLDELEQQKKNIIKNFHNNDEDIDIPVFLIFFLLKKDDRYWLGDDLTIKLDSGDDNALDISNDILSKFDQFNKVLVLFVGDNLETLIESDFVDPMDNAIFAYLPRTGRDDINDLYNHKENNYLLDFFTKLKVEGLSLEEIFSSIKDTTEEPIIAHKTNNSDLLRTSDKFKLEPMSPFPRIIPNSFEIESNIIGENLNVRFSVITCSPSDIETGVKIQVFHKSGVIANDDNTVAWMDTDDEYNTQMADLTGELKGWKKENYNSIYLRGENQIRLTAFNATQDEYSPTTWYTTVINTNFYIDEITVQELNQESKELTFNGYTNDPNTTIEITINCNGDDKNQSFDSSDILSNESFTINKGWYWTARFYYNSMDIFNTDSGLPQVQMKFIPNPDIDNINPIVKYFELNMNNPDEPCFQAIQSTE